MAKTDSDAPRSKGRPFQKGRSGNPGGRPKKELCITSLIKEALAGRTLVGQPVPDGKTAAEWLAESIIAHAIKGEPACMRAVMDRVDGPVIQPSLSDGRPSLEELLDDAEERANERRMSRGDGFAIGDVERRYGPDWRKHLGVVDAPGEQERIIDVTPADKGLPRPKAEPKPKREST